MSKSTRKTRQKLDPRKFAPESEQRASKERDWTFEDILRSKRGRK